MKVKEKKWIRFRTYVVATFFLLGLAVLLVRAYQLQVLERNRLESIARAGYIGTTKLPPERGTIYDRDGNELALSIEVKSIYAHPKRIKEKFKTAKHLSGILGKSREEIVALLKSQRSFVWIARQIPIEQAKQIAPLELDGVGSITESRRYYPGRESAAHLIGFVGADNQGLEGIERKYDSYLKGPQHSLIHMRDALGRPFSISRPIPSGQGMHDLVLTIDKDIQYKAHQALLSAVRKAKAKSGQCLVLDPETGGILAMAVVPEFNPNVFARYEPDEWRNRTVTDCFEPGSTIKAFLLAAALSEYVVTPNTHFDCEHGKYKIGRNLIRDTHEYDVLSVSDIIMYSSNIGAIKIGHKLGYKRLYEYLKKFGFGSKTGIDLLGERDGFIRKPNVAKPIEKATLFFGQGMTATCLQLATAMGAIANGGKLMRPYVVKAIRNASGGVKKETKPAVVRRVLSPPIARKVSGILEGVVSEDGTGAKAAIDGFRAAGKTGTSQKVDASTGRYSRSRYVATFAGFVPADRPRLVIVVVIDEPKGIPYGGVVAAPAFGEVGLWSLNHLEVNPQIRLVKKNEDAVHTPAAERVTSNVHSFSMSADADFLPDFRGLGMRKVIQGARALGLKVLLEGTGLAFEQDPKPGASLKRIRTVKVMFRPPT
jgi:cell division protein FtsI (penicillin-binding protein 3)